MTKKVKKEVQIVLTKTTTNLGKLGTLVSVKSGYARNYILPLHLGQLSTVGTIRMLQRKQKILDLKEKLQIELCLQKKNTLEQNSPFIMEKRVSEDNKIFGKVTLKQVRTIIESKTNLDFANALIEVPEIKEIGIFYINIILHSKVKVQIQIQICPKN